MFLSFKQLLHIRIIKYQLKVFLNWRYKKGMTMFKDQHESMLLRFFAYIDKTDVLDVTDADIECFVAHIWDKTGSRYQTRSAESAVRQFVKFYSARGKMTGTIAKYNALKYKDGVQFIADRKRNRDLVLRRLKDPKKWSWRRLGEHYGLHFTTARQIFYRDVKRYNREGIA